MWVVSNTTNPATINMNMLSAIQFNEIIMGRNCNINGRSTDGAIYILGEYTSLENAKEAMKDLMQNFVNCNVSQDGVAIQRGFYKMLSNAQAEKKRKEKIEANLAED